MVGNFRQALDETKLERKKVFKLLPCARCAAVIVSSWLVLREHRRCAHMALKPGDPGYRTALISSCIFFMICSAGMLVVNKLVLRAARLPITVVMIQMAFTVLCLVIFPCGLHFGSLRDVLRWSLSIPILFTLMLASSMLALDHATMGAIIVVRNIAPIVTMVIERIWGERIEINFWAAASLVYVIGGVVLYTSADVSFSAVGMAYMFANMVSAVLERLLQRKMIAVQPIDVSKTGMMLLNNACALVPMWLLLIGFGEHHKWHLLRNLSYLDAALLFFSCINAVGISYAGINAQGYVSATTFMVLSNLNKFVVVAFGIVVLHEAGSWRAIMGCFMALSGGVIYARTATK